VSGYAATEAILSARPPQESLCEEREIFKQKQLYATWDGWVGREMVSFNSLVVGNSLGRIAGLHLGIVERDTAAVDTAAVDTAADTVEDTADSSHPQDTAELPDRRIVV